MNSRKTVPWTLLTITFCLLFMFSACSPAITPEQTAQVTSPAEITAVPSETATLPAAPTAQPRVLLVGFDREQDDASQMVQELIQELAEDDGLLLETVPDLQSAGDLSGVKLVIVASDDGGIEAFRALNPELALFVVGASNLQPSGNLSTINASGVRVDQQGFLAGYLASIITLDWRVGVISQADSLSGKSAQLGFRNGVVFYCGLCRPVYPPFFQYPLYAELPAESSPELQQTVADLMINSAVKTVYVDPGIAEEWLLDYLAQAGINLILGQLPGGKIQERWVASLQLDQQVALREAWQRWSDGDTGFQVNAPLAILATNTELLSPGRLRLVEQVLDELNAGYIDSGVDLLTGEPR